MSIERTFDHAVYQPGQTSGMYESFFLRGNHPSRPLAFWIRYTLFSPDGRPADALGETWAIWFDGERGRHTAVRQAYPIADCDFARDRFAVRIADATLGPGALRGAAGMDARSIAWDLRFAGEEPPLFLLPREMYVPDTPTAKSLVALPLARFTGTMTVDGETQRLEEWLGSVNHNWGARHTDQYAYGQVAGFDGTPDVHLEAVTARVRVGDQWTPFATSIVLRRGGREHALNGLPLAFQARAQLDGFAWTFENEDDGVRIAGSMRAPVGAFVGLGYLNPPGGRKHCLNTKIARCEVEVTDKTTGHVERLVSAHGGLFEVIPPDLDSTYGVPIVVQP
jgi:hypothetical protein